MKEYSKGIYVKFKSEEVDILHNRMQEAGVQNMSEWSTKIMEYCKCINMKKLEGAAP